MTGIQALEQKTLLYDSENCKPEDPKPTKNQGKLHVQSLRYIWESSWIILIGQIFSANIIEKNNKRPKK